MKYDDKTGIEVEVVSIDKIYLRVAEVEQSLEDPSKAKEKFGLIIKTNICELLKELVDYDCP